MPNLAPPFGLQPSRLALPLLALAAAAVVAGVYARWAILPDRPLAVDEYYFVQSVRKILAYGLPAFETGGYYDRGLPLQYLTAGAVLVFGESLLAYRLPTFLFSLLSIVLTFVYARRFVAPAGALAVASALLVSSWHIEFAGFIRMYALFQCLVLLWLIAVDDAFFSGGWRRRYLPHGLAVLATTTHDLGVTLTPLLFLPLVAGGPPGGFPGLLARLRFALVGLAAALLCVALVELNVVHLGVENPLPPGYGSPSYTRINLPIFPFWSLATFPTLALGLAVGALALGGLGWLRARGRNVSAVDVWLVALVLLSAFHLFALALPAAAAVVLRFDLHRPSQHPRYRYALLALAVLIGAGWLMLALVSPAALTTHPAIAVRWDLSTAALVKSLWSTFFGWPDISKTTLNPFREELPGLGLLLCTAVAVLLIHHRRDPLAALLRLPWLPLAVTLLVFGVVEGPYSRLRYWYHLYPVMLCTVALALEELVPRLAATRPALVARANYVAAGAFLALFGLLSDFDPRHIARIQDDAVTFRTGPFADHAATWYPRFDYRTPAAAVNALRLDTGARVVVEYHYPVSFDLEPAHAIYIPRDWRDLFPLHSRVGGTVDRWSNRPLLSTAEDLAAYARCAQEVWLIRGTDRRRPGLPEPEEVFGERMVRSSQAFVSRDGRIEVLRVALAPPDCRSVVPTEPRGAALGPAETPGPGR